ncbi:MAG: TIR domain-containing protein [Pseudomonadota bacterium]|nr:TIR domain-containing protein [Pseudomonadota bacterium]
MRRVFFSFHYERDVGRIGQIRNSWLTRGKASSFLDAAKWESIKRRGDDAIRGWINEQLRGTSVTVVLIGAKTANRRWVKYEIEQSIDRKNGLLGIYIHNVKDFRTGAIDNKGKSPFSKHFNFTPVHGQMVYLTSPHFIVQLRD